MANRINKVKTLKFRDFPTHWHNSVFFVENGYSEQLNLSIINHLDEIRELLKKKSLDFIYFPYLIHEVRDAAVYNFPQMTKADFSLSASSDILLQHLDNKKSAPLIRREDSPEHRCPDQSPLQLHQ